MSQDTNLKSKYEASLLEKYRDMFPNAFIECVKNGVTWLANHNGLTYQTSALISTDNVVYEANKSSILKIGLINVDKPLSGMQYYSVRSMVEEKDSISGNTIFKVKLDYTAPVGIEIMMIPIAYFSPYAEEGSSMFYTKEEVVGLIQSMKQHIELDVSEKLELVKQEAKAYTDSLIGSMEDLDFDFGNTEEEGVEPEAPSDPSLPSVPQKPATPIQKIVEHLHSVSMNLAELGKESNISKTSITEIQDAVKQLQAQLAEGSIATPDLYPGITELPPYYTMDEVDLRLATKVSNVTFEQYVAEAEQKFVSKKPSVEVPDAQEPSEQLPDSSTGTEEEVPPKKEEELPVPPVVDKEDGKIEGEQTTDTPDSDVSKGDQESTEQVPGTESEGNKEPVIPEGTGDSTTTSPSVDESTSTSPDSNTPSADQEQSGSESNDAQPEAETESKGEEEVKS